jgi:hypothetical protein
VNRSKSSQIPPLFKCDSATLSFYARERRKNQRLWPACLLVSALGSPALARGLTALLMDEPFAALDAITRESLAAIQTASLPSTLQGPGSRRAALVRH